MDAVEREEDESEGLPGAEVAIGQRQTQGEGTKTPAIRHQ